MARTTTLTIRQEWATAWQSPRFRKQMLGAAGLTVIVFSFMPFFFQIIDKRQGIVIDDRLLDIIPAHNVSICILLIVWAMTAMTLVRCVQSPELFMHFLWIYTMVNLFRFVTITLVPLDPPANLIGLVDPMSNAFYGAKYVTKDLFFSGHTSAMFLMFLCLPNRSDKILALTASILVGILVLVQHVHYTMDVVAAPVFTWIIYRLMSKILAK